MIKDIEINSRGITKQDIDHVDFKVTQDNQLIECFSDLTLDENKIIFATIAQVLKDDKDLVWIKFSTSQIVNMCNLNKDNIYKKLKQIKKSILNKTFTIDGFIEDSETSQKIKKKIIYHWVDGFSYDNQYWYIHLHDKLKPFLLQLKSNFTSESLNAFVQYKTLLGFRLHGLFARDFDKKTSKMSLDKKIKYLLRIRFTIESLKKFSNTENKYDRYFNFKERILLPAVEDINYRGFFSVDYEEIKTSKKVTEIVFFVSLEKNNSRLISYQNKLIEQNNKSTNLKNKALQYLLEKQFYFDKKDIKKLLQYSEEEILNTLSELKKSNEEITKTKIFNYLSILNKNISKDAKDLWENL